MCLWNKAFHHFWFCFFFFVLFIRLWNFFFCFAMIYVDWIKKKLNNYKKRTHTIHCVVWVCVRCISLKMELSDLLWLSVWIMLFLCMNTHTHKFTCIETSPYRSTGTQPAWTNLPRSRIRDTDYKSNQSRRNRSIRETRPILPKNAK